MFDGISYFKNMAQRNRLVIDNGFHVGECSGLEAMEPMMDEFQTKDKFVLVDDTVDGSLIVNGSAWFNRRVYTVAVVARPKWDDAADAKRILNMCRQIFRQFLSRLIVDKEDLKYSETLVYMRTEYIRYREMNGYNLGGTAGLVFTIPVDEPANLELNDAEWKE